MVEVREPSGASTRNRKSTSIGLEPISVGALGRGSQLRSGQKRWTTILSAASLVTCLTGPTQAESKSPTNEPASAKTQLASRASPTSGGAGTLRVVTYNVAGLPEGWSNVHPIVNLPLIAGHLAAYDLALIQEDYAYPELLRKNLALPYASAPFVRGDKLHFGDGLSTFAKLPFAEPSRTAWTSCHGVVDSYFDCLTPKGFSRTTLVLGDSASKAVVHVYNVHLDAGWSAADRSARARQLAQLSEAIRRESSGQALLVGGDFNLTASERDELAALESRLGLRDVCTALRCSEPRRIDRFLVRSSSALELTPTRWSIDARFRDSNGRALSDHLAVAIELRWRAVLPGRL
ncbi:MAG TPA: endonuclease/exonuclease/phosphatase family protein [Polyangiaceae bacterium]|nr:endonuclease/exonuclease/phosphatase family protein [Polyangiaceae bacterium]